MSKQVIRTEDFKPGENPGYMRRVITDGPQDGTEVRPVKCHFSDGTMKVLYVCNTQPGYFRQAYVPWDMDHPEILYWPPRTAIHFDNLKK